MNEKNILLLSIKDFLTPKMLKYALLPFLISIIIMYLLFFVIAGIGIDNLATLDVQSTQTTMQNGIPHTESLTAQLQGSDIIKYLMSFAVTSWVVTFLIYAIGGFLTLHASIFVAIIIVGFLTPLVMRELQRRHYRDVEIVGHSNIFEVLFSIIKWSAIMIVLFILLVPFYFIPFVNIIAFNLPLYYFFHKMLTFDVSTNLCSAEEDRQIKYFNKNSIRAKTLLLYVISFIPFVVLFGAIFYVIYLGHTYFIEVRKLRQNS
ncbi:MAG: EI24 domain-containing protein [Sulfurimonas sp.]|uniref:EI24 domain-containing protein n=1 Tax=Sulfurimonas sp. TaxID=2022749 RepID=UPI002610A06F|nr:EI24 domain-containing protein [Sulfurimonas sp.]MCW8894852.1 EI24 domain-containing protein [Sulfurimonas sp.]MCW8953845.1 EI24 domain-containing protein [Sulfurimonas sp.]MCW9067687.1 EI24 domain-containing protein [Sulfurimonas sp.]